MGVSVLASPTDQLAVFTTERLGNVIKFTKIDACIWRQYLACGIHGSVMVQRKTMKIFSINWFL